MSRASQNLDTFLVSNDSNVYTAAWDHNIVDGEWRGWWRIKGLTAKLGAPVAAIARDANKLDIFSTGIDGKVYTAAWDHHTANGKWQGWWQIGV